MKLKKFLYLYLPIIIWMAVIFSLSSIPGNGVGGERTVWFYIQRKGAHVFEYFVLTLLFVRLFKFQKLKDWKIYFFSGALVLIYAYSDEFHQLFVFQREGKLTDVGIDSVGIILGLIVYMMIKRNRIKFKKAYNWFNLK